MKAPAVWSARADDAFRSLCAERWGFAYRDDDGFTLRDVVERAYQASDAGSLDEYAERIATRPESDPEVQAFVGRMVVGETSFFRNAAQFDALARVVLPELVRERRRSGERRLRIWSAGCSSGEEPYSVAILLASLLDDWRSWDVRIVGTDLNPFALRRAEDALYSEWSFREAGARPISTYFTRTGRLYRLDHPCKELVEFRRHNLALDRTPNAELGLEDLDLILCRNVTIYFDRELTTYLANAFFEALRPGGWLVVGHTEPDPTYYGRFDRVEFPDTIFYRRPVEGASSSTALSTVEPAAKPNAPEPAARIRAEAPATLEDARAAYDASDPAGAFALLHEIAERDASDPVPYHLLAQISADEKRYDEALYWAFVALQADAFHVPTLLLLGLVLLERGDAERAKAHFNQALFLEPTSAVAHFYLSMAHRALGDEDRAERSGRRASRLAAAGPPPANDGLPVERAFHAIPRPRARG